MIHFPLLSPYEDRLLAVSTTREGGVSTGNYASMNLCDYVGDHPTYVAENRRLFCAMHHIDGGNILFPRQTHGDRIIRIDAGFLQQTGEVQQELLYGVDAIITQERNVCIGISTADCVPVLLYDPQKQAIGAVHAGWRGTVAQIAVKTVNLMKDTFGSNPEAIIAAIAPCISKENYEVGSELYKTFEEVGFPCDILFTKNPDSEKYHLDLRAANHWLLTEAGISQKNICISDVCTFANPDKVFSARKSGIDSGRIASCMMLR